ncbi:LGFP repeat-containing protein [Paenibacillus sp. UNC496MF]|uniref:LGFP repeat-containing protein n=1 Tax=Paenibacillus sp. UNC496MF TaxID=1502753 RepID=UPI0008E4DDA4|nr:hypothetical protein [Paenibacillus sp. UNC496MF]SFJ31172.1 LGFP repeat-containing protein [Paenibacillus sp. UNC496MF]
MPQFDEIADKARQFNLGNPTRDTPEPRQTPPPRDQGWYQHFERGSVYWSPATGAHMIIGTIRDTWSRLRWEQGVLGFPVTDELPVPAPYAQHRYQLFEGGGLYWHANTNTAVLLERKTERRSARYRVTINGFTVNQQTSDHILEVDGKGDEIYIAYETRMVNMDGSLISPPYSDRTKVLGDTNNQPNRVQAGSLSNKGGIRTGDNVPTNTPWAHTTGIYADRLPLAAWEGVLVQGRNAVAITPSIWEYDGGEDLLTTWSRALAENGAAIGGAIAGIATGMQPDNYIRNGLELGLPALRKLISSVIGTAGDRPIGMVREGDTDNYVFHPQVLLLTYEACEQIVQTVTPRGRGIISLNYKDDNRLGAGNYTLFVQVDRITDIPTPG